MSDLGIEVNPLAEGVAFTDDELIVSLLDGRKVSVPLTWSPRLAAADEKQRTKNSGHNGNCWAMARASTGRILMRI